jgi:hypothetical protein
MSRRIRARRDATAVIDATAADRYRVATGAARRVTRRSSGRRRERARQSFFVCRVVAAKSHEFIIEVVNTGR